MPLGVCEALPIDKLKVCIRISVSAFIECVKKPTKRAYMPHKESMRDMREIAPKHSASNL